MPDSPKNPAPADLPQLSDALRIGPYLLGRRLGEGGMGVVYLGRDEALDRNVAIKLLHVSKSASEELIQRFTREAKATARLNHPNAVTIYQFGQSQGQLYLVMEHIEGGSLAEELQRQGRLPWQQAARAIRDAARGLAAAHEAGLVHRDIKPSNLMRTRRGEIKLVDFGLARVREPVADITQAGMMIGTPQYMAPEQFGFGTFDGRSDLYALTCTFYTLLTGTPPFVGLLEEVMHAHLHQPFPDPRQVVSEIPSSVCEILDRGSRKRPAERYQTAGEIVAALDAALFGQRETALGPVAGKHKDSQLPYASPATPATVSEVLVESSTNATAPTVLPPASIPNNIPSEVTSFIGRARELAEAMQLLARMRVVTLLGPGGTGKTRLGLRIAAEVLALSRAAYPDGVWFVELASLSEGALVPQALAQTLGIREDPGRPLIKTLCDNLARRRVLILLDNCEHVIDPCARLAEALTRCGPGITVLATSREALGVAGEAALPIPPLGMPDTILMETLDSDQSAARHVLGFDAVRLFVDRATAIAPSFQLTSAAAPHVARICRELDGIPLAIELAAARVGTLGIEQIAERLEDRFRLLTRGSRTALPRQRTLRALIDWSYDLLDNDERNLLATLSVFAGGWSLEAAEAVGSAEGNDDLPVLDLLSRLQSKSLIIADDAAGGKADAKRYRMLETIRHYAAEKLVESDAESAARDRHLDFFLRLAETAELQMVGPAGVEWSRRLEIEHDNLRAAMDWAQKRSDDRGAGLRVAAALYRFWVRRGYLVEGRRRLEELLARTDGGPVEPRIRAKAFFAAGRVVATQWDSGKVSVFADEALRLYQECGDAEGIVHAMGLKAHVAMLTGDYRAADTLLLDVMEKLRRLSLRTTIAETAYNLGLIAHYQGENYLARQRMQYAIECARELQDPRHIAVVSLGWAFVLTFGGEPDKGMALCHEAIKTFQALADVHRIANSQVLLAFAAAWRGDLSEARQWCAQCLKTTTNLNDRGVTGMAMLLQGQLAARQGDLKLGADWCQKSLNLCHEANDKRGIAWALATQGWIAAHEHDAQQAQARYKEALDLAQRLPDWRTAAQCIEGLAALEATGGRHERAAELFVHAAALRKQVGCPLSPPEKSDIAPFATLATSRPEIECTREGDPAQRIPAPANLVEAVVSLLSD